MKKVDVTKNYLRYRQFDPSKCQKGTFRTKTISDRTKLILCQADKDPALELQSILKKR